jgi:hypothetical protein
MSTLTAILTPPTYYAMSIDQLRAARVPPSSSSPLPATYPSRA